MERVYPVLRRWAEQEARAATSGDNRPSDRSTRRLSHSRKRDEGHDQQGAVRPGLIGANSNDPLHSIVPVD
jgi:hypothetical protein